MEHDDQLSRAIGEAATNVVPAEAGDYAVGDYLGIAEVLLNDGRIGLAVLAPTMTLRHLLLLIRALDQTVNSMINPDEPTEGDADAI